MNWAVPSWWPFLLLGLAAFRTWRVLAEDVILRAPRARLMFKLRPHGEEFIECPWCLGFWIAVAWWLAWVAWPHGSLVAAVPLAISAVLGLIAANLDPE